MGNFDKKFMDISYYINNHRKPDFNNLIKVLNKEKPNRSTLFELFLNDNLYQSLVPEIPNAFGTDEKRLEVTIKAFKRAGYDYASVLGSDFGFKSSVHKDDSKQTLSMNEGNDIYDWESFERYPWPEPENYDYSRLDKVREWLEDGMKLIVFGFDGVLENVTKLIGFENLCYLTIDNPELVQEVFNAVGSRLLKYYEICANYDTVGAIMSNDDWGFSTQTMLSLDDMKKYVTPWHKKIANAAHKAGKPALLHSCGQLSGIMDHVIDDLKYDGKHSYEDKIISVEDAYKKWGRRIAVLGGIDVDYLCRSTPEEIYNRSVSMLEQSSQDGGYALGSGNSIASYVPVGNYLAMIAAVNFNG